MIIRLFKARIKPGKTAIWQEKVEKFSIPWLQKQKGIIHYFPGKPLSEKSREYCMISIWDSMDSLKQAVGDDWDKVVLLEDEASLVEDTSVEHFETFDIA